MATATIGPDATIGDMVSFEDGGERHDFMIAGRRWIIAGGAAALELTLDHPVRRGL